MTEQLYRQMSKRPVRPPPPVPKPVQENTESIDFPLHEAAKRGNITFLTECINNQVSVNGLDKAGSTPLHWAAHGGHIDCLEALLEKNCEVNVQNKLGDTPLHSAAWRGHADVVKILLDKGAVPSIRNNEKRMPLDLAKDNQCPQEQVLHKIMETKKTQTNSYLFLFVYCFFFI
ncbi:hypothetical protein KUTeg_017877 [Tegillarca granosa]|uniref:Uncharacterized protein n=1 Tax=Tegillarca granosa TaxID=220873 RepID=A0ABQ9EG73_TEGGR|nr:hypothetical protein KUTeg_017877 [Tegillarca granosa]